MISIENVSKSFGGQNLFEGISFQINSRERIGLVGRNGHGKTTLFSMISNAQAPNSGNIIIPKNYRIGYVRQHIDFKAATVLDEGALGLLENERDQYWKVEKILGGLGFSANDMQRHPGEFSGGFQVRLNLAKILVSEPDLLMLDEPTNYLDIASIRWVERFLANWPREILLITHDRSFMDKIVTHTLGIHRKKIRKIQGNTEKYYARIAQDEEIYEKTRINDERRTKEIEQFITRFRAKARLANMVQSRIKTLAKMDRREKLESLKTLEFSFHAKSFQGKHVLSVNHIDFGYDVQKQLIKDLSFSINRGDRICIVGKNGKGKTTLLKLLAGTLSARQGNISYNPSVTPGVFEQTNIKSLVDSRTIEEEILYSNPAMDRQPARNICGAMMFSGDNALKKISILSGGEKSRVMLGKILATPVNLLLLDEPTNHLDMESSDSLLAAIDNFDGTVVMVTHNEMFLHALAQRLIVFEKDRVYLFEGTYQDFLDKCGWEDENIVKAKMENNCEVESEIKLTRKQIRQKRSEIVTRRSKDLKPLERRMKQIEDKIETNENQLSEFNSAILDASRARDGSRIAELSRLIHTCQTAIDDFFEKLEHLSTEFDEKNAVFEKQLEKFMQDHE
ncbi:MAG: ABC-F family ATP-binding cassette domain-containing protein [Deltaproteobacteria bacterium]|nr:ABC-F family ATP-binding cassette domain-containing protein [Deltaproteobacteria bacterium]